MHPNAGLQMVKMEITEKVLLKKLSLKKDPSYVQTACLELLVLLIGCGLCSVQNHYMAFKKFLKPV